MGNEEWTEGNSVDAAMRYLDYAYPGSKLDPERVAAARAYCEEPTDYMRVTDAMRLLGAVVEELGGKPDQEDSLQDRMRRIEEGIAALKRGDGSGK